MKGSISVKLKVDYKRILMLVAAIVFIPLPWTLTIAPFFFLTIEGALDLAIPRNTCNPISEPSSVF